MCRLSLFLFLCCFTVALPAMGQNTEQKANILWIIAEDMGPELPCYGYPGVATPNIDFLAEHGVVYTHAYTTAPVCSPSRSAFMTGMYQTSIGAHNHRSHRNDGYTLPPGVRVLTDWLRDGGYYTANIVHLTDDKNEQYYRGTGKTDWNFHYEGSPFDTDRWADLAANQPFYAQINFPETHRGGAWDHAHEYIERPANPDQVMMPPYYPDHPEARQVWAQYLNTIMSLDNKVGRILENLQSDGLADNTIVIFMADHGRAMVRGKQWPYESGLHIPLIVYWPTALNPPDQWRPGSTDLRLALAIDVAATTLSLAGISPPLTMQGRVFLGKDAAPERLYTFGGRDRGDETVDRIRTVRDHAYRYIRNYYPERPFLQTNRYKEYSYPMIPLMRELHVRGMLTAEQARLLAPTRPEEELYNLETDPYEIKNLVLDPSYREKLHELRAALDTWITETNDQGRFRESQEILQYWETRMKENYDERIRNMLRERKERQR